MSHTARGYRPEIDGLRAVAILSVVAYHAGVPGVTGGFIGVDVFFVISGFLITGLLLTEVEQRGRIDLLDFFSRRARRLLPALFLVVAVTLVLGALFLIPLKKEQTILAQSVTNALLYVSNFYFAQGRGYFDPPTELSPMLHTWSLAVEEQFYLVWPTLLIILGLAARSTSTPFRRWVVAALAVILVVSFTYSALAAWGTGGAPESAFFLITSRAWELAAGALLAVMKPRLTDGRRIWGETFGVFGVLAIVSASVAFDRSTPFPGVAALAPVLGATAIIAAGIVSPNAISVRWLASAPMVAIGLVSYSWYLWHWPLLAIARSMDLGNRDLLRDAVISLVALGLAAVTYRFIEDPIRRRRFWGNWNSARVLGASAAATVAVILSAHAVNWFGDLRSRLPGTQLARLVAASEDVNPRQKRCSLSPQGWDFAPRRECTRAAVAGQSSLLLWGDSHADHLMPLLEAAADRAGFGVVQRTQNGCRPFVTPGLVAKPHQDNSCSSFNEAVRAQLADLKAQGVSAVVLAARWNTFGDRARLSLLERTAAHASAARSGKNSVSVLERRLSETLSLLTGLGFTVLVVADVPEQPYNVPWCLARRNNEGCSVSRALAEAYRTDSVAALQRAVASFGTAKLWDPFAPLCLESICPAERDGIVLYADDDHLSASAARSLLPAFADAARWIAEPRQSVTDAASQAGLLPSIGVPR